MRINLADLQASLKNSLIRHRIPGASIAVLQGGKVAAAAAGVVNIDTGVELTPETVMHIGSITKVFNSTLMMQLVDEGKVELDAPILQYAPNLTTRDRRALERITIRMLLNHTSGIDGDVPKDYGHDEETIDKAIERLESSIQIHPPGAEFSYCNVGAVIAGYVVQRVRSRSWYSLIRERIFEPLGMMHAATLPEEALLHRTSVGHYLKEGSKTPLRVAHAFLPLSFGPAGASLMMSAVDLVLFAQAHINQDADTVLPQIISPSSAKLMRTVEIDNKGKGYTSTDSMGLGWMITDSGLLQHSGGGPGVFAALYAYPKKQFAAAILTNAEHGEALTSEFMDLWLREAMGERYPRDMSALRTPSEQTHIEPERFAGVYENSTTRFRISIERNELTLSRQLKVLYYQHLSKGPSVPVRLIPLGGDQFVLEAKQNVDQPMAIAHRIVAFRHPDSRGCMRYLGNGLRLYPRAS